MALKFNWPEFSDDIYEATKVQLTEALNSGPSNAIIVGKIVATDIFFGKVAPQLEILEICDLSLERVKGIFKVKYDGDFSIEIKTKAQVNPVKTEYVKPRTTRRVGILAANKPLVVPITVRMSSLKLAGIAVLDIDTLRGVSFNFKNDPLISLKVNTSFDDDATISQIIQDTIEGILRDVVNNELPEMIHELTKEMITEAKTKSESEKKAREKLSNSRDSLHENQNSTVSVNNVNSQYYNGDGTSNLCSQSDVSLSAPSSSRTSPKLTRANLTNRVQNHTPSKQINPVAKHLAAINDNSSTMSLVVGRQEILPHRRDKGTDQDELKKNKDNSEVKSPSMKRRHSGGSLHDMFMAQNLFIPQPLHNSPSPFFRPGQPFHTSLPNSTDSSSGSSASINNVGVDKENLEDGDDLDRLNNTPLSMKFNEFDVFEKERNISNISHKKIKATKAASIIRKRSSGRDVQQLQGIDLITSQLISDFRGLKSLFKETDQEDTPTPKESLEISSETALPSFPDLADGHHVTQEK